MIIFTDNFKNNLYYYEYKIDLWIINIWILLNCDRCVSEKQFEHSTKKCTGKFHGENGRNIIDNLWNEFKSLQSDHHQHHLSTSTKLVSLHLIFYKQ